MRFLYFGLDPIDFRSTLYRETIRGMLFGVRQLGNEAGSICYDHEKLLYSSESESRTFPLPESAEKRESAVQQLVCDILRENQADVLYIRGLLLNHTCMKAAICAKLAKPSARAVFEPGYNTEKDLTAEESNRYEKDCGMPSDAHLKSRFLSHRIRRSHFRKLFDAAVLMDGTESRLWGIPAICVSRGICVGEVIAAPGVQKMQEPVSLIGVVGSEPKISGYERVLYGLANSVNAKHSGEVTLDLVGSDENTAGLRNLAEKLSLSQVRFLNPEKDIDLKKSLCRYSAGLSSLGFFRAGCLFASCILSKYYCASGIPFIYASEDISLRRRIPFALQVPNLDSAVDIEMIAEFVWRCRLNPELARQEQKFAQENYDWRVIMKRILEFSVTGKREE